MKKSALVCVLSLCPMLATAAEDIDNLSALGQPQFEQISKDLTAAFSYKAGAPAESLGITGFDVGVGVSSTKLEYGSVWQVAMSSNSTIDNLIIPKVYAKKGLPFGIDVGGYYFKAVGTNIDAWGAELKYAIIDGNVALPAVAVRGAVTNLSAGDQLSVDTQSVDLSISKGFLMVTPYAGIGRVWSKSTPEGTADVFLDPVKLSESRNFIGVSVGLALLDLSLERDSVGGIPSYNLKLGVAF